MGFKQHVENFPDKPALIMSDDGETRSYAELDARANQYAQLFRSLGLNTGDGIAFTLENCAEFFAFCFGALRAGLYYTAISTYLKPNETSYIIGNSTASVYISSALYAGNAAVIAGEIGDDVRLFSIGGDLPGYLPIEEAIAAMSVLPIADETKGQDLLYSSGTTGQPKGVKLELTGDPPDSITPTGEAVAALYGYNADTIYLSPAPLYHAAPLRFNLAVLMYGGTSVIMRQFDPVAALESIETWRCTHSQWVPTMFIRMLKLPRAERKRFDTSSMKLALHAAAPCPVAVKERMIEWWGPIIYEYYAGSENNGFCQVGPEDWLAHKGTVGRALYGELHILDEDGTELPIGEVGTVWFAGGNEFEYLDDPEKTRSAHNDQGWSTLGDVGYVDEEGYLYLTDRLAFMIISGGVNVYPQEVENLLVMHPLVTDVAVFGVPHGDLGEQVKAVVQLARPQDASPEIAAELIRFCRDSLSRIKCPRTVDFMDSLPRHATGKLYKRLLRDPYWT